MTGTSIALAVAAALIVLILVLALAQRLRGPHRQPLARAVIAEELDSTSLDDSTGAVRSVQGADLYLPAEALGDIWTPMHLERLARTYWRFLSRVTLGLIRVRYTERERFVVLLVPQLKLLTFHAPEYELDPLRGLVRWRIARGLLVARRGHDGDGYLQIEVRRDPGADATNIHLHIEVEVANFYPSIASSISRRIYNATQSRIHVIVTHGFLRSLERLDLAESRVGRFERS
jgi:hypothetical protein